MTRKELQKFLDQFPEEMVIKVRVGYRCEDHSLEDVDYWTINVNSDESVLVFGD